MREFLPGPAPGRVLLVLLALAAVLLLLSGCTATAPSSPAVPLYMVHVPGNDHGMVLLVGRSDCPHCQETKTLLANLSVDYYWIDLNTLDQAERDQVMAAVGICGQVTSVPILVINNQPPCIVGYQEERIREALG